MTFIFDFFFTLFFLLSIFINLLIYLFYLSIYLFFIYISLYLYLYRSNFLIYLSFFRKKDASRLFNLVFCFNNFTLYAIDFSEDGIEMVFFWVD